ncbi:AAEL000664-PA [Aedes aegypti]|uniref:AAEL000664-PA n=1 Tax=Aedes aegypti TaxID=7159 RepID=Q17NJ3_AEDAE|nr:AAEL000664-PA [Aedes aegypti]
MGKSSGSKLLLDGRFQANYDHIWEATRGFIVLYCIKPLDTRAGCFRPFGLWSTFRVA